MFRGGILFACQTWLLTKSNKVALDGCDKELLG